ncbi:MAG: hypothetical protein DRI80_16045 [Chloroflexota bacterium]|nr:MAG: hypothetical protein DRI80_16045 [Chloroflexota bacterium]
MGVYAINDTSEIHIDDQYLTIRITRRACASWIWELITKLVHTASERLGDGPAEGIGIMHVPLTRPWRYRALDWLSQIVYLLLIPADHFLARLDREADFSFIDELCAPSYKWRPGKRGRPPWPAQLMFRLLLLMFLYGVPCETMLVADLQINIAWRWFVGLGLLEKVPDHSTLYDFRKRLGPQVFVQILARILLLCLERGLICNVNLYFDFTAVHASAVPFKPYQRAVLLALAINRYLDQLEAGHTFDQPLLEALRSLVIEVALEAVDSKSLKSVSPKRLEKSLARLEQKVASMPQGPHWQEPVERAVKEAITTETPPNDRKGLLKLARRLLAVLPQACGDLHARLGKVNNWEFCFGYLAGYVVDGLFGIITAVILATANAWQAALFPSALEQHRTHVPGQAESMTIDSAFDFPCVYQALDEAELKGYIAPRDHRGPKGCFGPERFTWKDGQLFCPNEKPMTEGKPHGDGKVTYEGAGCATCDLREQCVGQGTQQPRTITVYPTQHQRWQENRIANRSEEYRQAQKQRMAWENVFGHGNTYHHGDKAPYRSKPMNFIAQVMTVIAIDLEKMMRYGNQAAAVQQAAAV